MFEKAIYTAMKGKTRILVTHQLHFLPKVDYVIFMKDGAIAEQGTFQTLMKANGEFSAMMKNYGGVVGDNEDEKPHDIFDDKVDSAEAMKRIESYITGESKQEKRAHMAAEDRTVGTVSKAVWWIYIKACGGSRFLFGLISSLVLIQACRLATDIWLVQWIGTTVPGLSSNQYVGIYFGLGLSQALSNYVLGVFFAFASTLAAKVLHQAAGRRIVRAPMSFFDTTPLGRIINRFSKDLGIPHFSLYNL